MININIENGVKERELTEEELSTVIATISTGSRVVFFQQGDEQKYNDYSYQLEQLQQYYLNELNAILDNALL